MKKYRYPDRELSDVLVKRPGNGTHNIDDIVVPILESVKEEGDSAVIEFTRRFDNVVSSSLIVDDDEIERACSRVDKKLKKAIMLAADNISSFHLSQVEDKKIVETSPGVRCWRESRPLGKAGLYIPGGTAPLFSSILMLAIPARIAGCSETIITTPPSPDGSIDPVILFTARYTGVNRVFRCGGAQAIAAMAYGTESVPRVDKIFGPGNSYVTRAKEIVQAQGTAIDMPAGPSELLVIADSSANPSFIAADLLSQAEHGVDSQVILLSDNEKIIDASLAELRRQLTSLPRAGIAERALDYSRAILLKDIEQCISFSNRYAPEHLILATKNRDKYSGMISSAGSVFLGNYSCESAGDYASGTNHTLPTGGYAKSYSGVSVDSFVKKISFQELSAEGIRNIGPSVEIMAEAEGLAAHMNAVSIRLKESTYVKD